MIFYRIKLERKEKGRKREGKAKKKKKNPKRGSLPAASEE